MRLIDADGAIEKLKNTLNMLEEDLAETRALSEESPNNPYNDWKNQIETLERNIRTYKAKIKVINGVPTAYDVDKVVKQIEKIMEDETIRFADQIVRKSIKIVKAGGVDE